MVNAPDQRLENVKDPDGVSEETRQEMADIKREEIAESDPNAYDVINSGDGTRQPILGDIKSLTINEKYALVLHQVKQFGPLFFVQVSPDTFGLPERDPLNLIWINILNGWGIATIILSQFEQNVTVEESKGETKDDASGEINKDNSSNGETQTDTSV